MAERMIHIYQDGEIAGYLEGGSGLFLCGDTDADNMEHNPYENPLRIEIVRGTTEVICPECLEILGPLKRLAAMEL